ncbi:MAG: hypothetical protein HY719_08915 [Planctomycetes bacterium]|nr:hypothetical protein [Planctomycetota bacterium]
MSRLRALAFLALFAACGCRGWLLGDRYAAEDLPDEKVHLWPIVEMEADEAAGKSQTEVLASLILAKSAPDAGAFCFLPLVWFSSGPGDRFDRTVFPVFWQSNDSLHLWPLAGWSRDGRDGNTWSIAWPFIQFGDPPGGGARFTLHPLLMDVSARPEGQDVSILGYRDFSLLYLDRFGSTYDAHLFPVFWAGASPLESHFHLWPTWGYSSNGEERADSLAWPFFQLHRAGGEFRRLDLAWPLVCYQREPLAPPPAPAAEGGPESAPGAAADGYETHFRLLPLLWFTTGGEEEKRIVFPLYGSFRNRQERTRSDFFLGPLYLRTRREQEDLTSHNVLWPFLNVQWSRDHVGGRVFPLAWWNVRDDTGEGHVVLFPVYWRFKTPSSEHTHVWPFYGRDVDLEERNRTHFFFLPLLAVTEGETRHGVDLLWPLLRFSRRSFRDDREPEDTFRLFPLVWYWNEQHETTFGLLPLIWLRDGLNKGSVSVLWPVFDYSWREDDHTSWALLWKLMEWWDGTEGRYDFRILHKFIRVCDRYNRQEVRFTPLFRWRRSEELTEFSLLYYLFEHRAAGGRSEYRFFHFLRFGDDLGDVRPTWRDEDAEGGGTPTDPGG